MADFTGYFESLREAKKWAMLTSALIPASGEKLHRLQDIATQDKELDNWLNTPIGQVPELEHLSHDAMFKNISLMVVMGFSVGIISHPAFTLPKIESYFIMDGDSFEGFFAAVFSTDNSYIKAIKVFRLHPDSGGAGVRFEDILNKMKEYVATYPRVCWEGYEENTKAIRAYTIFVGRNSGMVKKGKSSIQFEIRNGYYWDENMNDWIPNDYEEPEEQVIEDVKDTDETKEEEPDTEE